MSNTENDKQIVEPDEGVENVPEGQSFQLGSGLKINLPIPAELPKLVEKGLLFDYGALLKKPFEVPLQWTKDPRKTNPETVNVEITVVRDKGGLRLEASQPNVFVNRSKQEEVRWTCPDGELEIRFSLKPRPFAGSTFRTAKGGAALSGLAINDFKGEYYIFVTSEDGYFEARGFLSAA